MPLLHFTTGQTSLLAGVKLCIYGRSGVGKTRLARTVPNLLIIAPERGTLSVAQDNLPGLHINTMADMEDAYTYVTTGPGAGYQTLFVDSVSELAEKFLSAEKMTAKDPRQAYGEMQDLIGVTLRKWVEIPGKNVVFIAKAALVDQPDGRTLWGPQMPGKKLGPMLPYFFDEVFYLGVGEQLATATTPARKFNFLQTAADTLYDAKDRSGALATIEPPDLAHIFNKIRNGVAAPPPPPVAPKPPAAMAPPPPPPAR